jgi:hypothetical protein
METLRVISGGPDLISQLVLAFTAVMIVLLVVSSFESLMGGEMSKRRTNAVLLQDTTTAQQFISQDPSDSTIPYMYNSKNEPTGIECSYSMYLMVNPETFDVQESSYSSPSQPVPLKHIFHRGFKDIFPMMSPGVFVEAGKNTLRIHMNSVSKWENHVSVPNIPVGKWFHLVLILKGQYLDVYVNGNVTQRNQFPDVPRINNGNVYVMWPTTFDATTSTAASPDIKNFKVTGAMNGMVSRLQYFSYALAYSDIDRLMSQGPSKTIMNKSFSELPPYFHDDWWVTRY